MEAECTPDGAGSGVAKQAQAASAASRHPLSH
jgi:hypothetical protein